MGFKYTSDTFQISAVVDETVLNTLATTTINLNLDSLSREILVIQYVDLDVNNPDLVAGQDTFVQASLNDANIGLSGISNSQAIAAAAHSIVSDATSSVSFQNAEPRYAQMAEAPIFVSATDDLYLSVKGSNNTTTLGKAQCRIYARRARADADTYAAILTSQFN